MRAPLTRTLIVLLTLLLGGSMLELAPAARSAGPAQTPACRQAILADSAELLAELPQADYACTEQIAAALRLRVDRPHVDQLIALSSSGDNPRIRRNAMRVLGRLFDSPRGSRAYELTRRVRGAALRDLVGSVIREERDAEVLQDAIWIADSVFFPADHLAGDLERIAADQRADPLLRHRAARARARLIYPPNQVLTAAELAFLQAGLASDAPGVQAAAADAIARLRDMRLNAAIRGKLSELLARAAAAAAPPAIPPDGPDQRGRMVSGAIEQAPGPLAALAALARAADRLDGGARLAQLRADYEALALPFTMSDGVVQVRSGLEEARATELAERISATIRLYEQIAGPALSTALPGEDRPLLVLIFPHQAAFHAYLLAFTNLGSTIDGVYLEGEGAIYTSLRRAEQSEHSLEESIQHELAHHLAATRLFPAAWNTPGYHSEPKGWADEGLAELLSGAVMLNGQLVPQARPAQLARLCALPLGPDLAELISRRAGYDRFGRFDYDAAWALSYYLAEQHPQALRALYQAFRSNSYRSADWATIAGVSDRAAFEAEWHRAIDGWCAENRVQ